MAVDGGIDHAFAVDAAAQLFENEFQRVFDGCVVRVANERLGQGVRVRIYFRFRLGWFAPKKTTTSHDPAGLKTSMFVRERNGFVNSKNDSREGRKTIPILDATFKNEGTRSWN